MSRSSQLVFVGSLHSIHEAPIVHDFFISPIGFKWMKTVLSLTTCAVVYDSSASTITFNSYLSFAFTGFALRHHVCTS